MHPQIPELPDNLKPAPGAEAAVVPKRRFQPPRPEEHFYAAMRGACASMELLVKDGRWVLPHSGAMCFLVAGWTAVLSYLLSRAIPTLFQ